MLRGKDILYFSSIDWDFLWQGHQQIAVTLAANGNRVLFVENTGVRPPRLGDLPRLRRRLLNWWRGIKGFRQEQENLFVYSPLILPFPYSWVARRVNCLLLLRALRRWMRATRFHRPLIWTFLPTPLVRALIRELDPALTVYYCIDDFASSSPSARRISRSEIRLFREADLVFVTSEKLRERAARFSRQVHLFPFGVNFCAFEKVRSGLDEVPTDLQRLQRPVVGYVGGVAPLGGSEPVGDSSRQHAQGELCHSGAASEQCLHAGPLPERASPGTSVSCRGTVLHQGI